MFDIQLQQQLEHSNTLHLQQQEQVQHKNVIDGDQDLNQEQKNMSTNRHSREQIRELEK